MHGYKKETACLVCILAKNDQQDLKGKEKRLLNCFIYNTASSIIIIDGEFIYSICKLY